MRHLFTRFVVLALLLLTHAAWAAPGDTTRVTAFTALRLDHHGAYDTTVAFPAGGGPYRKVLLHYVLGRYQCPAGSQYCGSWDYTTRVQLISDSLELARVITPYATDWLQAGQTTGRSHDYILDVTDYAARLSGPQRLRYFYDGWSWGFTVTLYFEFIEGTPPRDVLRLDRLWEGGFAYGRTSDPIENHLTPRPVYVPGGPPVGEVALKTFVTGHGADDNVCAEFCSKYYDVLVDSQQVDRYQIWRDDCGRNPVSPQTGTWVYERANWCPGQAVQPVYHNLTAYTGPGTNAQVDVRMQPYTAPVQTNSQAAYIWQGQAIVYGPANFQRDVDLRTIISPTTDPNFARQNPRCEGAMVRLRNGGSDTLRTITLDYRIGSSGPWQTYTWTGALGFLRETDVALPLPASAYPSTGTSGFTVVSHLPAGQPDQNAWNDTLRSRVAPVPTLQADLIMQFRTNNSSVGGVNETSWQLLDETGAVVRERVNLTNGTLYADTLHLQPGSCYTLHLTDAGCDGFAWWANPQAGNGSLRLLKMNGRTLLRIVSGDFGCEYNLRFRATTVTGLANEAAAAALDVWPNPSATGRFSLGGLDGTAATVRVLDAVGREVAQQRVAAGVTSTELDLQGQPAGIYLLRLTTADGASAVRRLVKW